MDEKWGISDKGGGGYKATRSRLVDFILSIKRSFIITIIITIIIGYRA